jgi:hypothetical protein
MTESQAARFSEVTLGNYDNINRGVTGSPFREVGDSLGRKHLCLEVPRPTWETVGRGPARTACGDIRQCCIEGEAASLTSSRPKRDCGLAFDRAV